MIKQGRIRFKKQCFSCNKFIIGHNRYCQDCADRLGITKTRAFQTILLLKSIVLGNNAVSDTPLKATVPFAIKDPDKLWNKVEFDSNTLSITNTSNVIELSFEIERSAGEIKAVKGCSISQE